MQKRGLAFNMVILLGLVLIVIVIMGFLIARSTSTYTKSTSCENLGGKCTKKIDCEGKENFLQGCEEEEICCMEED